MYGTLGECRVLYPDTHGTALQCYGSKRSRAPSSINGKMYVACIEGIRIPSFGKRSANEALYRVSLIRLPVGAWSPPVEKF